MLSSKFLALSFLYILYAAGLAAADPRNPLGGDEQFCQSVRTVTVTQTVTPPGKPSSVSRSANAPLPVLTTRPGNVNLGNGATSVVKNTKRSSVIKNTKTSSVVKNTKTSSVVKNTKTSSVVKNTKTSSVVKNTKTSSVVKNTKTSSIKVNTKTSTSIVNKTTGTVKNSNTNTKTGNVNTRTVNTNTKNVNTKTTDVKGTKTTGVLTTSTGLSTTSPPPLTTTDRSLVAEPSSTATPPPVDTNTGDPNTSLTLDPSVIQNIDGKGQAAGEANSLVSTNNFIGFCVGKTITNGKQVQAGSCNPVPMGDIPSVDNMPSAKFSFPKNFDTIAANTPFTISITIRNLVTGTFTNAANTYYAAPQQLVNGVIQGHSHVTVQLMTSLDSSEPLNPKVFAFFKGLNGASSNGVLTADVTKGLPAGVYRLSSINSAGNHQEALGPIAQRGSFNDVVYFTVTDNGAGSNSISSSSSAVPPASTDTSSTSIVDPAVTPSDVSSSSILSSTVSSPDDSSTPLASPTGKGGKGGKGGERPNASSDTLPVSTSTGVTDTVVSSATLPVSTSVGGKKGGKGGDVVSTSTVLPQSATPPTPTSDNSSPTKGANGRGGKVNGGSNGQRSKRMHKRSHWA